MRKSELGWSLERFFKDIAEHLPADIVVNVSHNRFFSQGILKRVYDVLRATRLQGHVNHITGDIHYISYALRKRKTILTILDCTFLHHTTGFKRSLLWFFWLWLPVKRSRIITAISESTRQDILRHVSCDPFKIKVIHCPVSEEFRPTPKIFNRSFPRILHIGCTPNKNLERHITALRGLNCELVIVGRLSPLHQNCLVDSGLRHTVLTGLSNAALVEEYCRCDLLLFASTFEGFGLPIVEAQAVGRPVITSNLWSMPEVAGNAACLVDPYNVASIRYGIERVINDDVYRESMVRSGFKNVRRFSVKTVSAQYAAIYREIADEM